MRALLCKTEPIPRDTRTKLDFPFDVPRAAGHLCDMLRYCTVRGNVSEFVRFEGYLLKTYENVAKHCSFERVGDVGDKCGFGVIFKLDGSGAGNKSVVLMSHYDVVPANSADWDFEPFSGRIKDGRIQGRGAVDTKCTLAAVMESLDVLLGTGFRPEADLYLCFAGDEETDSLGAVKIVELLQERGVRPYLVLDEGGGVLRGQSFGIDGHCAMVGIAEKGLMNIEFTAKSAGGHTSVPNTDNPVDTIGKVIRVVNNDLFPFVLTTPMRKTLAAVKRIAPIAPRILVTNIDILGGFIKKYICRVQPELAAMTQSVCHVTQVSGSNAHNVVPSSASALANIRVISDVSCDTEFARIKRALRGVDVDVKLCETREPSKVSLTSGEGWDKVSAAVHSVWDGTAVIPFVMLGATDSASYSPVSDSIYRFTPGKMDTATRKGVHGVNESLSLVTFGEMCEFYIKLIKTL
ncbi:peptidase M20 [Clostridia bacterium]|nr:peptidase M20 [Clostridia bacterium]